MPLPGTLEIADRVASAPQLSSFAAEPLTLKDADLFHVLFEADSHLIVEALPPATQVTFPPTLSILVLRAAGSDIGPITMAEVRIGCRTGILPKNFLISAVVNEAEAADALASKWGYRCELGEVRLDISYDRVDATVTRDGTTILAASLVDPHPLAPNDLWYAGNLNLANTPRGPRLLHVDHRVVVNKADRGKPEVAVFDGDAWGEPRLRPAYPISASCVVADVTFPAITNLNVPDVGALAGAETLDESERT